MQQRRRGQHFRAGVGVVVRRGQQVLVFERVDTRGAWQYPQGGLELGERPIDAAWRELGEETGLDSAHVTLVAELDEWLLYEYPVARDDGRLGQVQRWFLFDLTDPDAEPVPDHDEFGAWRWEDPHRIADEVVPFRRATYRRVVSWMNELRP